jgi:hypothetical protein
MRLRAYSFTTSAPDRIHSRVIEKLESELRRDFGDTTAQVEVPNQIYFVIVTR